MIKIGDKVKIASTSPYYGSSETNPKEVIGEVVEITDGKELPIAVRWPSHPWTNSYSEKDLVLISRSAKFNDNTTLPQDSNDRKDYPIYSGPIRYFPKALAEVAKVCKIGNDKHNPGQPLHHARGKSGDHADCIIRHLIDLSEDFGKGQGRDENGIPQVAYIAWRALALAQQWFEDNEKAPLAPGAKL